MQSHKDNEPENNKIEEKLQLKYCPIINIVKPVKVLKNKGINITAKGIKYLKLSSNVKE